LETQDNAMKPINTGFEMITNVIRKTATDTMAWICQLCNHKNTIDEIKLCTVFKVAKKLNSTEITEASTNDTTVHTCQSLPS